MAGTLVMTNYGIHNVSGSTLKTAVDGITTLGGVGTNISGAGIYFVPVANGQQVLVLGVEET